MEQKKSTLKEIKATVMPQTAEGLQMLMEETGLTVGEVIDRLTLQMCPDDLGFAVCFAQDQVFFSISNLPEEEQEKALSAALIKDLGTLYTHALSFYLSKIPQEDARGGAVDQITFFVCVPPYIPLEKKRQTIELLNNTMVREVGYKGEMKVIVLFQYHDDEGVGKDGELFADFKARQAQQ